MEERINHNVGMSVEIKLATAEYLIDKITHTGSMLVDCLLNDKKIFLCANGASAANCFHFSYAMLTSFEVERPALPVITLVNYPITSLNFSEKTGENIFARQIQAIAENNDVLIIISATCMAENLLAALNAARDKGLIIIVLTGGDGGIFNNNLNPEDVELRVQSTNLARIREVHLFILHCFCELIEQSLFNVDSE